MFFLKKKMFVMITEIFWRTYWGAFWRFTVNFLCQTLFESFYSFYHWRISFRGTFFCNWHFLKTSIFKPLYFLKWRPIFYDFYSTDRKTSKLVVGFEAKECATVCVKSEVILTSLVTKSNVKRSQKVLFFDLDLRL